MGAAETKDSTKESSGKALKDYVFGEHEHNEEHREPDALHRGDVLTVSDRTSVTRAGDRNESPLETFAKGYEQLKELRRQGVTDSNDPRVKELIAQTDAAFQKAWPTLQDNGAKGAAELISKPTQMAEIQQQRQQLDVDLKKAGVPEGVALAGDALKNAILNAPSDEMRSKLTRIETLKEMEQLTANGAAQNMADKAIPIYAGLKYADFLETWKNGVTRAADAPAGTPPISSLDVLLAVNSHEMQAMGGREAVSRAGDTQARNANQVIPADKNPLAFLQAAIAAQSPQDALTNAQKAAELAKNIKPEDCQQHVKDLTAQMNAAGDAATKDGLAQQIKAWQSLEHSSGLSNTILGRVMMAQQPPDLEGARKALLTAASDPVGANMMLGQDGQPIYNQLLMAALTKGDGSVVNKIQEAGQTFQRAQQLAQEADKEKNDDRKKQLLDEATRLGGQVIEQSKLLKDSFAGKTGADLQKELDDLNAKAKKNPDGKPTPEEQEKIAFLSQIQGLGQLQSQAIAATASWDMAKGDGHAAQDLLNQLNQNDHPEFFVGKDDTFKAQLQDMGQKAASLAEDQDIAAKAWYNPMKYLEGAYKFCKDNAKWIAFGVALVGAAAITIGTAGAGAPVGAAIIAGAAGGFIGGAVVGGGLEYASGRAKNLGEGMWNVAPYAAAGGAAGALGAYYFAPAALTALGGEAAGTSLGVASGFFGNLGAGFVTGTASGALWNAGTVRDGYRVGKYDNWKEAAMDWGTGTAAWGVNGALFAAPIFRLGGAGIAELAGTRALTSAAAKPLFNLAVGGMSAYAFPKTAEGLHTVGNLEMVSVTHEMPRWLGQSMGMSRRQIEESNAYEAAKRRGEVQEPQGGTTRTDAPARVKNDTPAPVTNDAPVTNNPPADNTPPVTYDPNERVNLDDFVKKK